MQNENNSYWGTDGGNDTTDKIFLLSRSEVFETDTAKGYGFPYSADSCMARMLQSSTYAKAMGVYSDERMSSWWWLRSPGDGTHDASSVNSYGHVYPYGDTVVSVSGGVRPALHFSLSSSSL